MEPVIYSRDSHYISRRSIDQDALKIMYRLIRHGYKAYLVGGAVRDLQLDKQPKDYDIATDATPRKVKALFRNSRIIGRRFKLAHIYFKNSKIIEVSTFRDTSAPIDPDSENGEQEQMVIRDNTYGSDATDALRRDLTVNGLFYDLSTFSIIDYVGGMEDLEAGLIRVIGEPDERFAEDPVRMIRAVRHAARLDFAIEEECQRSIRRNAELISQAPAMRLFDEMKKDFCSGHVLPILSLLAETGLLDYILPELIDQRSLLSASDSGLAEALELADERVQQGQTLSHSDILALIAVWDHGPPLSTDNLPDLFDDERDIQGFLDACYPELAVPRKEREGITDVIKLWLRIAETSPERRKASSIGRRRSAAPLLALLELHEPRSNVVALLHQALKTHGRPGQQRHSSRRGRSRTVRRGKRKRML